MKEDWVLVDCKGFCESIGRTETPSIPMPEIGEVIGLKILALLLAR